MSPKAKQRTVRLVLILSFAAGVCLFLAGALRENIVYFKTPTELLASLTPIHKVRLGGLVVKGTMRSTGNSHQFLVSDEKASVAVHYSGRLPDLFREGQGIVAIGTYDQSKQVMLANQLLAKHDQYYRPKNYNG